MVCKKHAYAPRLLTWHQPYRVVSTPLWWLFKKGAVNSASHSFKIRCDKSVGSVRLFVSRKECYIKATKRVLHKSDQKSATQKATNNNNNSFFKNNSNTFLFYLYIFTTESATTLSLRTLCPTDCQVEPQKWRGSHL